MPHDGWHPHDDGHGHPHRHWHDPPTRRLVLAAATFLPFGGASAQSADAQQRIADQANRYLALLDDRQRRQVLIAFDSANRVDWHYIPRSRSGLSLGEMSAAQSDAARALFATVLNEQGLRLLDGVRLLEGVLREQQGSWRDPGRYYLSVFGTPGRFPWGWRFEGHHLSVNVTELGPHGQIVAPLFMGANPARVPSGPRAGLRLLAAEEDLAFELLQMLDPQQRARATIAAQTFGDIVTGNDPTVTPMTFAGLPAAEMTIGQQRQLRRLLEVYAGRMADSSAQRQLERINDAGFERLHFAWAGAHQPGNPHYYRIHGPTVLVEYDNSQGSANHIHSVWRDLESDFGGDLLRKHYAQQPHRP
jgi:hypothetical protein